METKKSKVSTIDFSKEWNGPKGIVYFFKIKMENGDEGQFSSNKREQVKFAVGEETDYTKEEKQNGNYTNIFIDKPKSAPTSTGTGYSKKPYDPEFEKIRQKLIIRQSCLSNAVALGVANGLSVAKSEDVFKMADVMYNWVTAPYKDKL